MEGPNDSLPAVLEGYASFLRKRQLGLAKHQPHMGRWVREFLIFAGKHRGYTFEQTLDLFLAELGRRVGVEPWQVQQAADAARIYRYQFRGPGKTDEAGDRPTAAGAAETTVARDEVLLSRMREAIRLRHYASSTEKPTWIGRGGFWRIGRRLA